MVIDYAGKLIFLRRLALIPSNQATYTKYNGTICFPRLAQIRKIFNSFQAIGRKRAFFYLKKNQLC